jgi:hypothetical protein
MKKLEELRQDEHVKLLVVLRVQKALIQAVGEVDSFGGVTQRYESVVSPIKQREVWSQARVYVDGAIRAQDVILGFRRFKGREKGGEMLE